MDIDPTQLDMLATYKLLSGIIVPRPIAWVTSLGPTGVVNLAPFSTFTWISVVPPLVAFTVGRRPDGLKDTARNVAARGEFVVNIGNAELVRYISQSSEEHPPHVSEVERTGLSLAPSVSISTPRLCEAPVSLECVLHDILEFGTLRQQFVIGEVRRFHVRDGLAVNGKIDARDLNPISRLGGPNYATLGEIIQLDEGWLATATADASNR